MLGKVREGVLGCGGGKGRVGVWGGVGKCVGRGGDVGKCVGMCGR